MFFILLILGKRRHYKKCELNLLKYNTIQNYVSTMKDIGTIWLPNLHILFGYYQVYMHSSLACYSVKFYHNWKLI